MKKVNLPAFFLFMLLNLCNATAQVGIGTSTPRGALDINSSTNGFVPPQVALTSVTASTPVVNPQTSGSPLAGTVIYNTATAGTSPNNVTPGYYFWNGNVWIKFAAGNTAADIDDDLRVTLDRANTGSNNPLLESLTGITGLKVYFFDHNNTNEMFFTLQLPHNWKDGTTIYPHLHWLPKSDSATGNVKWNMDYSWANLDTETFSAATTITTTSSGALVQNKHIVTEIGTGITGSGKTYSSVLICRVYRDGTHANDTYTDKAGGLSMDFHISIKNPFVEYPD